MTKTIHIVGNSGCGKSLLAVNLAIAMQQRGRNVLLVDANIYSPDVCNYLGFDLGVSLNEYLYGERKIHETIINHPCGIKVIGSHAEPKHIPSHDISINKGLLELVGHAELIIVDSFALNPLINNLYDKNDELVYVMGEDYLNVAKAREHLNGLEKRGFFVSGLVVNKSMSNKPNKSIEKITEKKILGHLQFDKTVLKSVNKGIPVVKLNPRCKFSKSINSLAEMIDTDNKTRK